MDQNRKHIGRELTIEQIAEVYEQYPGDRVRLIRNYATKPKKWEIRESEEINSFIGTVVNDYPTYFTVLISGMLGDFITAVNKMDLYTHRWHVEVLESKDRFRTYMNPPEV